VFPLGTVGGAEGVWGTRVTFTSCVTKARAVSSFFAQSRLFTDRVGLRQGCLLSPILLVILMDRISKFCRGEEGV